MKTVLLRGLLSVAIALAIPLLHLLFVCRDPFSEACVWGKAYLPLSLVLWGVIATPVVFGGLWLISAVHRRKG